MSAQVIQFCQDIATLDWPVVDAEIYVASVVTEDHCYAFHGVDSPPTTASAKSFNLTKILQHIGKVAQLGEIGS